MQTSSDLAAAAKTWDDPNESLDSIQRRIHDGVPLDALVARGQSYVNQIFDQFPSARPPSDASFMEIGSGVGYIMQAMREGASRRGFTPRQIIGLDISEHMISLARSRLQDDPTYSFVHYDGIRVPLPDQSLDFIYSVAALQHVPKIYVYGLFFEIKRLLKSTGQAVIHLLGVKHLPKNSREWRAEIDQQLARSVGHWHFYYSAEELDAVFRATGFAEIDIRDGLAIWSMIKPGANA